MMIVSKQTRAGADKGNGVILTYKKKHLQEQPEGSKRWKQEAAKGSRQFSACLGFVSLQGGFAPAVFQNLGCIEQALSPTFNLHTNM